MIAPEGADPTYPASDDRLARDLRGFGPLGILAVLAVTAGNLIVAPLSAVLVLAWARRSRTRWPELGFARPRSWIGVVVVGVVLGVALKLAVKAIVMPLLGADPINRTYHHLAGDTAAAVPFAFQLIAVAGFGEETYFRGYLFERLGRLFGRGVGARAATVLLTSALFGSAHALDQGLPGVQQATIVGLLLGTIFAVTGRIWMLMVAHAAFDLTALAIIYWGLETRVAHLFFE